ncbi:alpha-ketoglutarate-dependent dioxygenase AlkB family protein [Tahibacter amnicola]|uniref:Alpha-ketoglutarate-dependent dioxygenase AlkB n=1 Tax=Tahibacter amnicola TaxID=2976241 RepID=A0ABY6BHB2_9GAMM|nr:alpha-ketoglutarate-dependent dioxygenase AlkB [Tahibacter amnicola]UXI69240.1 alpha-ketoglutarate-dependent dioxygenase AlkB [Tahibacter amnicola]
MDDLFPQDPVPPAAEPLRALALPGADLLFSPCAFTDAASLFAQVMAEVAWSTHRLILFGRQVDAPRLSCWMGDPDAVYTYSRTRFVPLPWTPTLAQIRSRVTQLCAVPFNSVLCNLYRHGNDSMGWHSDDEPELGPAPVIASVSLGATRRFRLHHRQDAAQSLALMLPAGSLLVMRGDTQRHYRHDLPKAPRVQAPRINLTFRRIFPPAS